MSARDQNEGIASQVLTVSSQGQITLPAGLRMRLGIRTGGVVLVEEREGSLVVRPANVLPLETYDDETVQAWKDADDWQPGERADFMETLPAGM